MYSPAIVRNLHRCSEREEEENKARSRDFMILNEQESGLQDPPR